MEKSLRLLLLGLVLIIAAPGCSPSSPYPEDSAPKVQAVDPAPVALVAPMPRPAFPGPTLVPTPTDVASPTIQAEGLPSMEGVAAAPLTQASPAPTNLYRCASGACPRTLEYAVNGCSCSGEIYEEDSVQDLFCCAGGFSSDPCPETLQEEALLQGLFGSSEEEVDANLVVIDLQGWPVLVHWRAEAAFLQVGRAVEGMDYRIVEPIEGFAWRWVEGSTAQSPHSFGIAVDINPTSNPSCGVTEDCNCYNDLISDMPPEFVQAFEDAGFEWGGDWEGHPDPMHFEWVGWRGAEKRRGEQRAAASCDMMDFLNAVAAQALPSAGLLAPRVR